MSAEQSVRSYGKEWSGSLSQTERNSVYEYTTEKECNSKGEKVYENINNVLRGITREVAPGNLEHARNIHKALERASIPEDCVVYRGASDKALGACRFLPDSMLVGRTISEDGFMSTSLDRTSAFSGDILLEIEVPKGAAGAYVGNVSAAGHYESEVLFDKDQVMIIKSVVRDEHNRRIIRVQMRGRG
ncbi:MAG: hypothetical protein IKV63_05085 [Clostridia bacterium]|nr:hypothetical protein [Clostridia bacterium]